MMDSFVNSIGCSRAKPAQSLEASGIHLMFWRGFGMPSPYEKHGEKHSEKHSEQHCVVVASCRVDFVVSFHFALFTFHFSSPPWEFQRVA
jgi:hypothetical protein